MSVKICFAFASFSGKPIANSYLPVDNTAKKTEILVKTDNIPKSATENSLDNKGELARTIIWLITVPNAKVVTFLKKELFDILLNKVFKILITFLILIDRFVR